VLEGVGLAQRRGGPIEVIRSGDRVFFDPGEDHWYGAAPNRFMTHIAMSRSTRKATPYFSALREAGASWQIAGTGWIADYPAASNFINTLSCFSYYNFGHFCDRAIDAKIGRALQLQESDPAAANESWAAIDRQLTDQAALGFLYTQYTTDFVSKRVGTTSTTLFWAPCSRSSGSGSWILAVARIAQAERDLRRSPATGVGARRRDRRGGTVSDTFGCQAEIAPSSWRVVHRPDTASIAGSLRLGSTAIRPRWYCARSGRTSGNEAGATGLEPATSDVTGRSWCLRARRE
jgi:hypothetical protein